MNVILLPIDIAVKRERITAIETARGLSAGLNAKFITTYVIRDIPIEHIPYEDRDGAIARAEFEALQSLKAVVREHELPDSCECNVRQGHAARQIISVAAETGADLIVMDSHSPGLGDFLLGSVAATVVRHAPCSVYVVRGGA